MSWVNPDSLILAFRSSGKPRSSNQFGMVTSTMSGVLLYSDLGRSKVNCLHMYGSWRYLTPNSNCRAWNDLPGASAT